MIKSKKLWITFLVFGTVFALAAFAVFALSLCGIRVFDTGNTGDFLNDLFFLISALVLSCIIILVSIHLKP